MINILYVDDDTDLLEITKEFLESSNEFLVDTSSSVQAAGVALRKKNYQAVVSDYQMPEKDGLCFLRDLKRKGNDIPFILFTGKGREEVAIKALNLGADFYLVKGGEPRSQFAELANMIKQAVGKREAEKVLNHYLKHFKELIENSTDIIAEIDESGNLKYVTPSVIRMLGYSPNELIGTPIADIVHPNDLEHFTKFLKVVIKVGKTTNLEMKIVTKDGDWRILNVSGKVVMNETRSIVINAHDITEKILMSNKIKNLIRTLTVLSEVNHIIVRTNDRDQLFQKVCHAAVEKGDFALAWIGSIDHATGVVNIVSIHGEEGDYFDDITARADDVPESKGPVGSAIRKDDIEIIDDLANDLSRGPWRKRALKMGFHAAAGIPIRLDGKVIGAMGIMAHEPGIFTEEEVRLLKDVGEDVSYAISMIEKGRWPKYDID